MPTDPPPQLTAQEQFDVFTDAVARALGTRCQTVPLPGLAHELARTIIDGDGRTLDLHQYNRHRPEKLRVYAALRDTSQVAEPSIGVSAISADHVAREIRQRLYPLHAAAVSRAAQFAALHQAEANARRTVVDLLAASLPGVSVHEDHRHTRLLWEREPTSPEARGEREWDSVSVRVGPSGSWLRVEASGRAPVIARMLAAFAQDDPPER
ncbi:hypothetical protein GCM10010358_68150 [Streptomyces minutiscleroticus]|uniref:Uncharacterized protein n=1 Tax=Streptomyces minutiscleroticus TaxID=68238 RepID=A0A918U7L4_9ACTN|nr:hypothetical protein [Streptomyces minutiscleroticus]GGY05131.1 hypothetical protein GCM10010358_68150 [Streptomyces minutiscleroticus]